MVLTSDAVIAVAGAEGTQEVIDLAWIAGKPVIPIPGTGEAARDRGNRYKPDLVSRLALTDEEVGTLQAEPQHPSRTAETCLGILRRVLRPRCFIAMQIGGHPLANCYETIWGGS
jgi:hypothetical protein